MKTLAEWLLVQIGADEAAIRAGGYDWIEISEYMIRERRPGAPIVFTEERALAVCEAHRRIVEAHPRSVALDYCETCFSGDFGRLDDPLHEDWPCPTLRALAAIYADHPDYREEWR